jgi:hypothetical protein
VRAEEEWVGRPETVGGTKSLRLRKGTSAGRFWGRREKREEGRRRKGGEGKKGRKARTVMPYCSETEAIVSVFASYTSGEGGELRDEQLGGRKK